MIVINTSPLASIVLMFSFSKKIATLIAFRSRMYFRQSIVFRAKRLIDLVTIKSILPALQAAIILLNCSRFLVLVPEIPSSANMPAISQLGSF